MHGRVKKKGKMLDPVSHAILRATSKRVVQGKAKKAVARQQLKEALEWR